MKCYKCKQEIDSDSLYCDQCGEKLYICPDCHIPGKGEGKRCGKCGKPLAVAEPTPKAPVRLVCRAENITLDLMD
ncbi:MAG: zinc ribbon domain-containing protein, partial [Muribaculaceae bacterium]|nr:zinc ribbon domain-containing protein [Muribaculaceae bacterium]